MEESIKKLLLDYIPAFLLSPHHMAVFSDLDQPLLEQSLAQPSWTFAKKNKDGSYLPQAIAHRGYKAKYPENTLCAFKAAVEAGAHALETDIHLTKDDEVVLSHDATLKRCFGKDKKIISCTWKEISSLRTLKAPHVSMPRLRDLLEYLASPGIEDIWLLLDIKLDNDPENVMRLIAETISQVAPHPNRPWNKRIVMGCWALKYLPLCSDYLPTFPISHIGFSTSYARQFLVYPNISFNLYQRMLMIWLSGSRFIRDAHLCGRAVYVWTVNEDCTMKWSIRKGVDGVITDDPKRFREVCDEWVAGRREVSIGVGKHLYAFWVYCMSLIWVLAFRWRIRATSERRRTAPSIP